MTAGCSIQSTSSWRDGSGIVLVTVSLTSVMGHGIILSIHLFYEKTNVIIKNRTVRFVILVRHSIIFVSQLESVFALITFTISRLIECPAKGTRVKNQYKILI